MGIENRRRSLEKSDLDSFEENRWTNQQTRSEELQSVKDLMASLMDDPIFSEQEAGKVTINTKVQDKDTEKSFEEISNEEMQKKIDNLFR